jgi:hypothetical protein
VRDFLAVRAGFRAFFRKHLQKPAGYEVSAARIPARFCNQSVQSRHSPRSKTDREGQGAGRPDLAGLPAAPSRERWLAAAKISSGPVPRRGARRQVFDVALADDSASRIVKRYAAAG